MPNQPRPTAPRLARAASVLAEQQRFTAGLSRAIAEAKATGRTTRAVITIALEEFADVRARLGPWVGNQLLAVVHDRLRACLGTDDPVVYTGYDEFHALIPCGDGTSHASYVAEIMHHVLAAPYVLGETSVAIAAYVGIAFVHPQHDSGGTVLRDAFASIHHLATDRGARAHGGCGPGALQETLATRGWLDALRLGVDRKQFCMHYQPILESQSGALIGVEALVRWQHPTRGCLAPSEFLEELQRSGLMTELGRWIIVDVIKQAVEWRESYGLCAWLAINLSPRQLADPTLVPFVLATMAETGARPSQIVFELTEEAELGRSATSLQTLRELRAAGFRVYVDDFGTGSSSLSYLHRLPIDGLKLDREFLDDLEHGAKQRDVVAAIVQLAHVLGLDVVAEGVERRAQLETLRAMGCDHVQGYFLSPPLSVAQMCAWLGQSRAQRS